jgi:hypothetical protein
MTHWQIAAVSIMNRTLRNNSISNKKLQRNFWTAKSKTFKLNLCDKLNNFSSSSETFTSQQSKTLQIQDRFISKRRQKITSKEVRRKAQRTKSAWKKATLVLERDGRQRTQSQLETFQT